MVKFLIFITVVMVITIVIVVISLNHRKKRRNAKDLVYQAYLVKLTLNTLNQSDDDVLMLSDSFVKKRLEIKGWNDRDIFIDYSYPSFLKDPSSTRYHVINTKILMASIPNDLKIEVSISTSKLRNVLYDKTIILIKDLISKNDDVILSKNDKKYIKEALNELIGYYEVTNINIDMYDLKELTGKDCEIDKLIKNSSLLKDIISKIYDRM